MTALKRYAQTQNQTASRERLMVLLFEAALRHIRVGASALESGRPRDAAVPLTKASDIVLHLQATLDPARAPALTRMLADIYQFVSLRLTRAAILKNSGLAREAERAFAPLVDGFSAAVAKIGEGASP